MVFPDVVQEEIGEIFRGACGLAWNHVAKLGQAVHHHPDGIVSAWFAFREPHNEIHAEILPWCIRHGVRLQDAEWGLARCLRSLAWVAVSDIALHILSHAWPEVLSSYELQCLRTARVAGHWRIVCLAKHMEAEVIRGGEV